MTNHNQHETVNFDNRDIARYGAGERRMPMRGFEAQYTDIVDYIIRITHRIWEEKAVGYIYDTYQHNCVVHGSGGSVHGREAVVMATLQTLAAMPDRRIYGDDVIWAGNEDDGFHTSHLITAAGLNTGYSAYGPPTGRKMVWRAIANCVAKENMIFEEWLLRDETSLIRQMGYDVAAVVEQQARAQLEQQALPEPAGELGRLLGQYAPAPLPARPNGQFDVEDFVRSSYHEIWNRRMLNVIAERYATSHIASTSGNRRFQGQAELTGFVLALFGMFPDAGVNVDQVYWNGDQQGGYRVAVRWTFSGTHTGPGVYGSPSGARVRVMGLSQHHIKHGVFFKEYSLFDEMELLRQIALQRLRAQASL
jgi:predicted ester cyclase